jgi:hypothetical protein
LVRKRRDNATMTIAVLEYEEMKDTRQIKGSFARYLFSSMK